MIKHLRRWNRWRKGSADSKIYKILVLFGLMRSPSMRFVFLQEEWKE